jgi:hypothetical protein
LRFKRRNTASQCTRTNPVLMPGTRHSQGRACITSQRASILICCETLQGKFMLLAVVAIALSTSPLAQAALASGAAAGPHSKVSTRRRFQTGRNIQDALSRQKFVLHSCLPKLGDHKHAANLCPDMHSAAALSVRVLATGVAGFKLHRAASEFAAVQAASRQHRASSAGIKGHRVRGTSGCRRCTEHHRAGRYAHWPPASAVMPPQLCSLQPAGVRPYPTVYGTTDASTRSLACATAQ